jgi:hypothetical protein
MRQGVGMAVISGFCYMHGAKLGEFTSLTII